MTDAQLELKVLEKSKAIAKILSRGKDVEIRKSSNGITIAEVSKKVVR